MQSAASNASIFSVLRRRLDAGKSRHNDGLFLAPETSSFESTREGDAACSGEKTRDSACSSGTRDTPIESTEQPSASQDPGTASPFQPASQYDLGLHLDQDLPPKGDESEDTILTHELSTALINAKRIASSSATELRAQGWALVQNHSHFSLYKRPVKSSVHGVVEYMMTGQCEDVSARTFFLSQVKPSLRQQWDRSLKEMHSAVNIDCTVDHRGVHLTSDKDTAYYRAKWPWPLRDRDYALARR